MSDDNKRFLDFLGVTAWHEAGWTGKKGLTATAEEIISPSNHAKETMAVFKLIAPDRKLIYLDTNSSFIDGKYTHKLVDESLPIILRDKVDTMYASLTRNICDIEILDKELAALKDQCCLFFAAGNDSDDEFSKIIQCKYVWGVGAYYLMAGSNEIRPAPFSSESEDVEFIAPTLINRFSGTSCSTPCLCGMAALVNDMAITVTGKPLPQEGMHQLFMENIIDVGELGKDIKTGFGAPVLPDPNKIDIWKYQKKEETPVYKDEDKISSWAKDSVKYCAENGILQGDKNGAFRPKDNMTREEVACALARLHKSLNK